MHNKLVLLTAAMLTITLLVSAAPSSSKQQKQQQINVTPTNYNNAVENLLADESFRNDEIQDDLTAADLDLDGAAATPESPDSDSDSEDDSTATDASESELRWLDNNNKRGYNNEGEQQGSDSNIENARINMSPKDLATAAGHHHHHGHYPHGWLEMGAETGKKGAFKWHDKHPVGGKGRR